MSTHMLHQSFKETSHIWTCHIIQSLYIFQSIFSKLFLYILLELWAGFHAESSHSRHNGDICLSVLGLLFDTDIVKSFNPFLKLPPGEQCN